ncbi:MAG: putative lipid II flippase FtsW [Proteobacteria bacterium]|nr:putative lipid II flippase FtsW [Pseudomonadota bacterium]
MIKNTHATSKANQDSQLEIYLKICGSRLIMCALLLTTIGLIMVYAASAMKGLQQFGDAFIFIRKQFLVAMVGFGCVWLLGNISEKHLRFLTLPLLISSFGLLSLILIPGVYKMGGGAARWVNLAGIRFQPSEIAKLALVFFLAKNLARPDFSIDDFKKGIAPNLAVFGFLATFMMLQPDFGSTVLMGSVMVGMLFVSGLNIRYIALCAGAAFSAVVGAIIVAPYRMARLTSFLDPWSEIRGGGFQIIQSYLAFQNGSFAGVGLGESKQKLFFLPEAHTDFILAVIGEEFGFLGLALVISLFSFFVFCGFRISVAQKTHFCRNLGFGMTMLIGIQATINMCVAMGMLPTKGIPLPFISSGASSLLVSLIATGVLWRLSRQAHFEFNSKSV